MITKTAVLLYFCALLCFSVFVPRCCKCILRKNIFSFETSVSANWPPFSGTTCPQTWNPSLAIFGHYLRWFISTTNPLLTIIIMVIIMIWPEERGSWWWGERSPPGPDERQGDRSAPCFSHSFIFYFLIWAQHLGSTIFF